VDEALREVGRFGRIETQLELGVEGQARLEAMDYLEGCNGDGPIYRRVDGEGDRLEDLGPDALAVVDERADRIDNDSVDPLDDSVPLWMIGHADVMSDLKKQSLPGRRMCRSSCRRRAGRSSLRQSSRSRTE